MIVNNETVILGSTNDETYSIYKQ